MNYTNSLDTKNKSGIYLIKNIVNNKVYVGKTVNFRSRYNSHNRELKRNIHENVYLQYDYNKIGDDKFIFTIQEFCCEELLTEREDYWLEFYKAGDKEKCYNIQLNSLEILTGQLHSKEFALVSPSGEIYNGKNIAKFSRANNLNDKNVQALLRGKQLSYKGWTIPNVRNRNCSIDYVNLILISPEGIEYDNSAIKSNIAVFARKFNLVPRHMTDLCKGALQSYAGWYNKKFGLNNSRQKYKHRQDKVFLEKDGMIYGPILDVSKFCKEQNIDDPGSIYKVINKKRKTSFGWKLT